MMHGSVREAHDPSLPVVVFDSVKAHEFHGVEFQSIASCFAGLGGSTNISGASSAAWMRLRAISKYFGSISMPMNFLPSLTAATPVVPEPMKGSRMVCEFGNCSMHQRIKGTGFCVGCARSFVSAIRL